MKKPVIFKILFVSFLVLFVSTKSFAQGSVTIKGDDKIEQLMSLKSELEKENKLGNGYTIQLYYGDLGKANAIIRKYKGAYEQWPASIEYETPNYKVWVGNFPTRLDADRALMEIKDKFPAAFILKPSR